MILQPSDDWVNEVVRTEKTIEEQKETIKLPKKAKSAVEEEK